MKFAQTRLFRVAFVSTLLFGAPRVDAGLWDACKRFGLFADRSKPALDEIKKVIAASSSNKAFAGAGGTYADIMGRAVQRLEARPDNFSESLDRLVEARRKVLDADLKVATNAEQIRSIKQQIEVMKPGYFSPMNARMRGLVGPDPARLSTPVVRTGKYSRLYDALEKRGIPPEGWAPPVRVTGLHAPPLRVAPGPTRFSLSVYHAEAEDVPKLLEHMKGLWNEALVSADPMVSKQKVAEFEWYFFATNPTERGGASLGDCMSIALQIEKKLPLRQGFTNLDFEALSRSPDEYIKWRLENWPKPKPENPGGPR